MTPPSRTTSAGRAYLDIQKRARADRRPVDDFADIYLLARRHRMDGEQLIRSIRLPDQFNDVVAAVMTFADPAITGTSAGRQWLPSSLAGWADP